jgi:tetratricopeptide (TPR) repeat protein
MEALYERERADAPSLFNELAQYPLEHHTLLVRNCPRFHTWGFCEALLLRSQELNFQDPTAAENQAFLALEVLDHLDPARYGAESLEDLRARSWSYVANSRRIRADLRGAEEAFALAFAALKRGTWEPMEKALLLDLKGSLLTTQRRFSGALGLFRRAVAIFLEVGETHRAGRALVKMSTVHYFANEPEQAIPLLYQALDLIDLTREPRLLLVASHNLIDNLAELGKYMEAQKLLVKARPLYKQFPQPWSRYPHRWVEGKIARGLGQIEQAEALLLSARDGFLAEGSAYDMALVSLDLASLYAEQGRHAEVRQIAEEMLPIFSSRQIHREALAALTFWRQAVQAEQHCLDLVQGVASFLKRVRHDPDLRFQVPE